MGSYLDKPETTKKSQIEENDFVQIGSSSMQGWRINQEDAHNSIPNFAENTGFFAVYDGHGGSEVAEYCSLKLPDFLKNLDSFKKGNYDQALKDAFIGFDATLLQEPALSQLQEMARKNPKDDYDDSDMDEDETAEEIYDLREDATMTISEVLEKYRGGGGCKKTLTMHQTSHTTVTKHAKKDSHKDLSGPSSSSSATAGGSSSHQQSKNELDNEVSSSSSGKAQTDENEAPSSSTAAPTTTSQAQQPDSTHSIPSSQQNQQPDQSKPTSVSSELKVQQETITESSIGDSTVTISKENKANIDDDSAITSSSVQENGEISNNCSSSAETPVKSSTSATFGSSSSAGNSSSSGSAAGGSFSSNKIPNHISSSSAAAGDDTESMSSSDEENKKKSHKTKGAEDEESSDDDNDEFVIKPKSGKQGKIAKGEDASSNDEDDEELDSDDVVDEEMSDEELSGEEDEEDTLDEEFMSNMEKGPGKASGCTAVVALLVGRELYVANAGDSRCVVCRGGKVVEMSFDHKPEDDIEFQRIRGAGGRVTLDGRVNGGLNLSRAIGDHGYKMNKDLAPEQQMISALPDIKRIIIEPEDEFMVLACDGIWNYMTNEEVVGFVKTRIEQGKLSLAEICEELFHNCLAPNTMGDGTGCDNMTAIIVKFKPALKELPTPPALPEEDVSETNDVTESETNKACKRLLASDDQAEAEALVVEPSEKRQKIEEDLTPSAVDTSTT